MRLSLNGNDWRLLCLPPSEWAWRTVQKPDLDLEHLQPPTLPAIPAMVPGDVQSDCLDAGILPDYRRDLRSRECEWTSHRDWVYWREFEAPAGDQSRVAVLRFEGVDYKCHVFLNGENLGTHEGTYQPFELDAARALRAGINRLVVVVEHAPTEPTVQGQIGWTSTVRRWKPRFAYGWDWCTRLVPLGIVDDVWLILAGEGAISDVQAYPSTNPQERRATVGLRASLAAPEGRTLHLTAVLHDPDGRPAAQTTVPVPPAGPGIQRTVEMILELDEIALWWPNGLGAQPLYRAELTLTDDTGKTVDTRSFRIGFRSVRALPNDRTNGTDALPYVLEVNGERMFIKGWNWAPIDQLYGRPSTERYTHALKMARHANCNLLRVWGGGLLEREHFYNLCDEFGLLVWQEFPHSSSGIDNEPPSDPEYLAYVEEQARSMVPRRRNHPSLVIWCGGNELMSADWTPLSNAHPTLAVLRKVVEELDPERIYLPTSPSGPVFGADPARKGEMHDVHGNWKYLGNPEHYRFFNEIDPLLHSEFGCEGAANLSTLRRILSEENLWPPDGTNPAWVHHGAWWLNREAVEALFGPMEDIATFVRASQWMQHEGLRYGLEASRRRKWRTSGAMPWQYNESWPNASGTYALDYFGRPKPAYWAARTAYAPLLISAKYDTIVAKAGEPYAAEVWLNLSGPGDAEVHAHARLADVATGSVLADLDASIRQAGAAVRHLGTLRANLPTAPSVFALILEAADNTSGAHASNRYLFSTHPTPALGPLLEGEPRALAVQAQPGLLRVRSSDGGPLFGLRLEPLTDYGGPLLDCGYLPVVLRGEEVAIRADGAGPLRLDALNAASVDVEIGSNSS